MLGMKTVDKLMLAEHAAETMVYFERHKLIPIVTRLMAEVSLVRPKDAREWMGQNIKRIAAAIYENCLKNSYEGGPGVNFFETPGRFLYRIGIYGRPCSGRRTMAVYVVKQFNVILLDANHIIYQALQNDDDELSAQLQKAFLCKNTLAKSDILAQLIGRRMLQSDVLQNGYVLINYPNTVRECKILFQEFKIPPNKFVYLQCPERMAMQRFVAKPKLGCPQDTVDYMEQEMQHFAQIESEMSKYLLHRHETIYVDSTPCAKVVRTQMFSKLQHTPYVMGFK